MLSGWGVLGWLKIWDSRLDGIELDSIYTTESTLRPIIGLHLLELGIRDKNLGSSINLGPNYYRLVANDNW